MQPGNEARLQNLKAMLHTNTAELPADLTGKSIYFNAANSSRLGINYSNENKNVILNINTVRALPGFSEYDSEHQAIFKAIPDGAAFSLRGTGYGWWQIL